MPLNPETAANYGGIVESTQLRDNMNTNSDMLNLKPGEQTRKKKKSKTKNKNNNDELGGEAPAETEL